MRNIQTICVIKPKGSVFVEKLTVAEVVMEAEGRDILGSHGGITENSCLLGCNAVPLGVWFPTFQGP